MKLVINAVTPHGSFFSEPESFSSRQEVDILIDSFTKSLNDSTYFQMIINDNKIIIFPKEIIQSSIFKFIITDE